MTADRRISRTDWLAGLVVGAGAGLLLAEWPMAGALVAIAFALPAAVSRHGLAALGGLLVGLPAAWLAIITQATLRCAEFNAQPGQGCVMSDATAWVVAAAALLAGGIVATVAAGARSQR
jgi:hypothetical protein